MAINDYGYGSLITPEIEKEMPPNLSISDQMTWRRNKAAELMMNKNKQSQQTNHNTSGTSGQSTDTVPSPAEHIPARLPTPAQQAQQAQESNNNESEPDDQEAAEFLASDSVNNSDAEPIDREIEIYSSIDAIVDSPAREQVQQPKQRVKSKPQTGKQTRSVKPVNPDDVKTEDIKKIPKSVVSAMRRIFPDAQSKSDLISAFVYVHTGGTCELTPGAAKLVESYKSEDRLDEIAERMSHLERLIRSQNLTLHSVELCSCYNLYDRRYGAKERRTTPGETEFREQGNLDLLSRLRRQAVDQREQDDIARGRQIYNQTKDKK